MVNEGLIIQLDRNSIVLSWS